MAKWKIVEDGTAINFDQVRAIFPDKALSHSTAGAWYIKADNVTVKSGFETEADAVEGIAELVKELEGYHLAINTTAGRRSAFPGVDNAS